jgi:hypothetical protein
MAASLAASQAMAADAAPLAPGKPSGVKAAQHGSPSPLRGMGAAFVVVAGIGIALATSNSTPCGDACSVTGTAS